MDACGGDTSLGGLVDVFGGKSFAVVFVLLLGVPALPLPTGALGASVARGVSPGLRAAFIEAGAPIPCVTPV